MPVPNTYSMKSVIGSIAGPGGAIPLGNSAGPTDEGITCAFKEELSTMQVGSDGTVMQSLHAGRPGRITVRLLKTSIMNGLLSTMFNFQQSSPANWGQNVIEFVDMMRGDVITLTSGTFVKPPDVTYDKTGRFNEWIFDGSMAQQLGLGIPNVSSNTGF